LNGSERSQRERPRRVNAFLISAQDALLTKSNHSVELR
jgi:hypothetical protein